MKQKLLLLFAVMLTTINSSAYDFEVDGIYYNVVSVAEKTCEVTSGDRKYSGDLEIPSTVTYNKTTVSVKKIGKEAFYKCDNLISVEIPSSITEIGRDAFSGCTRLEAIDISDLETWCKMFVEDYSNPLDYAHNLYINGNLVTDIVIPNSIKKIRDNAFASCYCLKSVEIPNSVYKIGKSAFADCPGITNLVIPNSVTEIGDHAFSRCSNLESIELPSSITTIPKCAFRRCISLTSLVIPNSVTKVGSEAFQGCTSLTAVSFPHSLRTIQSDAFDETNVLDYTCDNENFIYYFKETVKNLTVEESIYNLVDFKDWQNLESIKLINIYPPTFYGDNPFTTKQYMDLIVYVPEQALAAYQSDKIWRIFWNMNTFVPAGIENVTMDSASGGHKARPYSVQGLPVGDDYKGIVVKNGRKMLRK